MIEDSFFRSMSLAEDMGRPERFAHYRPTRRVAPLLSAVLAPGSATMVIAPYGSGKSLAAGVASLAVRNATADREVLSPLVLEIAKVDPQLGKTMQTRVASGSEGLTVVLSGHEPDPLGVIARAAGMDAAPKSVEGFRKAFTDGGWDHVAIVWDEFGRHLEGLVANGRPDDLDLLQRLAERCARASAPSMSLTLLLHQNLLAYASRLNETTRSEWRKIEGRFAALRMVEDSQEIYQLIGQVTAELRPAARHAPIKASVTSSVMDARWLDGMEDPKAVDSVLTAAQPLTPGALQILPTLVARVGQNERSLFTFLREVDLTSVVGIEEVYVAFSDALRSDVGIGGAYRRWLETESARSRARNPLQREALAAACLLQLGASGERRRLPRSVLELAVLRHGRTSTEVAKAVDELLAGKLLIWRRHNDDVGVWHGADIDVSTRLTEERDRQGMGFDAARFLQERFPAPNLRPTGHNARKGVNRFFFGEYVKVDDIGARVGAPASPTVEYVLARTRSDIDDAVAAAGAAVSKGRIIVVPLAPVELESAAVEVLALEALRSDRDFVNADPMMDVELAELQSVAFEQLSSLMRALLDPFGTSATWWADGRRLAVSPDRPASITASELLDDWYGLTPAISNDQLMRDRASRTMQTARVRVVGAILDHQERERLGYHVDDRGAEGSIYRTVLERTGLHRADKAGWRFTDPDELEDKGLKAAWTEIALFFRTPTGPRGVPLSWLIDLLWKPPYGVPKAVMPLLIAAGYKRFARTVAIYRGGVYLSDVLGFQFDQLVSAPEDVTIRVEQTDIILVNYLRELCYAFTHRQPGAEDELIRSAYDAVTVWRAGVPDGSRRTQKLERSAMGLLRAIDSQMDPVDVLLRAIPAAFGSDGPDTPIIGMIERARIHIDGLADQFAQEAMSTIEEAFRVDHASGTVLQSVTRWAACFDHHEMDARGDLRISDKAVLRKAVETANGRFSPKSFAGTLSSILLQRPLDKWDDRTAVQFRAALRETRERIEGAALDTQAPRSELKPIVVARMSDLASLLAKLEAQPGQKPTQLKRTRGRP